jgi:hypothetical protein
VRLAGQRSEIRAQGGGLDQPAVRRHVVALGEQDQVAGHERVGRHGRELGVAQHLGDGRQQAAQCGDRAFGAVLLREREHAIDRDHAEDRHAELQHAAARARALGHERERGRHPEDQCEEVRELAHEAQPERHRPEFLDAVRAELALTLGDLGVVEPALAGAEAREHL